MNSKINFSKTRKVLTIKSRTLTHFIAFEEHMADIADRNKLVCEVTRNTNVLLPRFSLLF